MAKPRYIETSKYRYRLLLPRERYKLLDQKLKLKKEQEKVESEIIILKDKRALIIAKIKKLSRMINSGKERLPKLRKRSRK